MPMPRSLRALLAAAAALLTLPSCLLAGDSFIPLDRKSASALVDAKSYAKPTVLALWSTDCSHCKTNLEVFARLARSGRMTLITVAAERVSPGLAAPLDKLAVPGKRYAYGDDAPEAIAFALDPKWRGELPRTLFFDGRGGRKAVSGAVDEASVLGYLGL